MLLDEGARSELRDSHNAPLFQASWYLRPGLYLASIAMKITGSIQMADDERKSDRLSE